MNLKSRIDKLQRKRGKDVDTNRYLPPLPEDVIEAILNDVSSLPERLIEAILGEGTTAPMMPLSELRAKQKEAL